ncbi:MAG: glycosyltransferase family 2 protein [Spirochaetia bacterium]|nr:glycosyltransferase family 2 protein [Spirochaetia bacterium]
MKKVSIVVACYNEEKNVIPLVASIKKLFSEKLYNYAYEIIFIDNDSTDNTQQQIIALCQGDKCIKAIFNSRNFGSIRSSVYGLLNASGDCVIKMCADFEDPPELIVNFVNEWEKGSKIVLGIKNKTKEKFPMSFIRTVYYKFIKKITDINHIDNFVGYGLYDKKFIDIVRELKDPMPYFRGIVAELGFKHKTVFYTRPVRKCGKSKYNFYRLYDYAMLGITAYSKIPLRILCFIGGICALGSIFTAFGYTVYKIFNWHSFSMGMAPVIIGIYFLGSMQLLFLGIMGEYILNINTRVLNRPLITEERRINFE